jgi:type I restriction enzyme S subunit
MIWEMKKLGEIASYINGRNFRKTEWSIKGLPIIRIQNLNNENADFHYCGLKIEDRYHVQKGDILISWSASLDIYIWDRGEALLNQHIFKVSLNENLVDRSYFFHAIKMVLDEMRLKTHGATMKHITRLKFLNIEIPLPPLSEQRRMVKILDKIFADITKVKDNIEKNLQNSRELFEFVLGYFFSQADDTWEAALFEESIENVAYTNKIHRKKFLSSGEFPIVSQEKDLINGYWDQRGDVFTVKSPIVLFGDHTKILKYVDFDFVLGADGVKILRPRDYIFPKFFYYFLKNLHLKSLGYSRHYRLLKEVTVRFPKELDEQKSVARRLDLLSKLTEELETVYSNKLLHLEELKNSVLKKAFSGEL